LVTILDNELRLVNKNPNILLRTWRGLVSKPRMDSGVIKTFLSLV